MILTDIFPFRFNLNPVAIAGASLWATALYLGFFPYSQWVMTQLSRWFDFAERSLYWSAEEFEKTRPAREAQNAFWASIFSILPFLILGTLCYYGLVVSLGESWAISVGLIALIGSGVYELGRRDGQSSK